MSPPQKKIWIEGKNFPTFPSLFSKWMNKKLTKNTLCRMFTSRRGCRNFLTTFPGVFLPNTAPCLFTWCFHFHPQESCEKMCQHFATLESLLPSLLHAYKHAQIPFPPLSPPSSFQISPAPQPQFPTTATTFFSHFGLGVSSLSSQ